MTCLCHTLQDGASLCHTFVCMELRSCCVCLFSVTPLFFYIYCKLITLNITLTWIVTCLCHTLQDGASLYHTFVCMSMFISHILQYNMCVSHMTKFTSYISHSISKSLLNTTAYSKCKVYTSHP